MAKLKSEVANLQKKAGDKNNNFASATSEIGTQQKEKENSINSLTAKIKNYNNIMKEIASKI